MDIDLLGQIDNEIDVLTLVARDVCGQRVEPDGMSFDAASVEGTRIAEDAEYEGVRVRIRGSLGTARVSMQLDVGFGERLAVFLGPVLAAIEAGSGFGARWSPSGIWAQPNSE